MENPVTVVSHAGVLGPNRTVYAHVGDGRQITLVVPRRWRDELRHRTYDADPVGAFPGVLLAVPTALIGRPQRHVALVRTRGVLRSTRAEFVVIEEEPFSAAASHWSRAARRLAVPYAVQVAETLPRAVPAPVRTERARVLAGATFVLARSPTALSLARDWGYAGPDSLVPHSVPGVVDEPGARPRGVVGFVGRLVDAKGVDDLALALGAHPHLRLRVAGDGPRRSAFAGLGARAELLGTLVPEAMPAFYDSLSVLAVPSRTTPTWSEQFGRVIIEAQARGVPVVAYDSGEIPWVAECTAVVLVDEGDVEALGNRLGELADDPASAGDVGRRGRDAVAAAFTDDAIGRGLASLIDAALSARR